MRNKFIAAAIAALALAAPFVVSQPAAAGPAQVNVFRCGQNTLRVDLPEVQVFTCGEASGDLRRPVSIVVNHSTQPITLLSLESLISSPAYGITACPGTLLTPGQSVNCVGPWVAATFVNPSSASVFTLIRAQDAQGQFINQVFNYVARF